MALSLHLVSICVDDTHKQYNVYCHNNVLSMHRRNAAAATNKN